MAESGEGTSFSVNPKEKKSLLDEEIGKDFLSSWKSMSVTEDDTMDFSFGAVSSGKKKFNFGKLDMDFNLDGDFNKLSSFKVDMPELDFSCSSEKTAKTKERNEDGSSCRNLEEKKDLFSFSFDFNDDDFRNDAQIGTQLVGNTKSVTKEVTDNELFSDRSEKNVNSPGNIRDDFNSDEQNGGRLFGESSPQDKQVTQEEPAISAEKKAGEQKNSSDMQIMSAFVDNSEACRTDLSEGEPFLTRSANKVKNLNGVMGGIEPDGAHSESGLAAEVKPQNKEVAQREPVMAGSQRDTSEDCDFPQAQISNKLVGMKSLSGVLKNNVPVYVDSEAHDTNRSNTRDTSQFCSREGINADVTQNDSKLVDNSMPHEKETTGGRLITLITEKDSGSTETTNKSSVEASGDPNFVVSSLQSIWNVNRDLAEGNQTGKRSHDESITTRKISKSSSETSANPKFVVSSLQAIQNVKNDSTQGHKSGKWKVDLSRSVEKMTKSTVEASGNSKFVVSSLQAICNVKDGSVEGTKSGKRTPHFSNSTEKKSTSSTACGNPKSVVSSMPSILKVKDASVEGIKTGMSSDISRLKSLRNLGRNEEVPNPTILKQSNSFRNVEEDTKLLANMASNISHPIGTQKVTPMMTVSLKRKKMEESNAELESLKSIKLSLSPKEIRYFKEASGRDFEEKACNRENQTQVKTKNVGNDNSTSGLEVSQEIDMSELEISVVTENDGNVERAEAYAKELEDICNMLKKKHEEAKELMVRAIINNNNLLMLNHPMYEEKISLVRKFATKLTFKEVVN